MVMCINWSDGTIACYNFFGNSLISWKSKKQMIVSTSCVEAEYRALSIIVRELQFFSYLLSELKNSSSSPYCLWFDNQAALHIAANPFFMNGLNIWRLIVLTVILFARSSKTDSSIYAMFIPIFNLLH